jgi:hypothetical protein
MMQLSPFDEAVARPILDEPAKSSLPQRAFAPPTAFTTLNREPCNCPDEGDLERSFVSIVTPFRTTPMSVDALDVQTYNREQELITFSANFPPDDKLEGSGYC